MSSSPRSGALARTRLRLVLLAGISGLAILSPPVTAQSTQAAQQQFDIPAQPLAVALQQFMRQSGLQISYPSSLAEGRTSTPVKLATSAEDALNRLLVGTGVTYQFVSPTAVTLKALVRSSDGSIELDPVRVEGIDDRRANGATLTEGTGSYTTGGPLTAATGMELSLRETPQSVSVITRQRMDDQGLDSLGAVMDQATGIQIAKTGTAIGGSQAIYARGYRVNSFQIDGLGTPATAFSDGGWYGLTSLDTAIYDSITVVRGATGLLNGAGDPSGSASLVRKRPTDSFQASLSQGIGSWNQYRTVGDIGGPLNSAATLRGRLVAAHDRGESWVDRYRGHKSVAYGVLEADLGDRTMVTLALEHGRENSNGFATIYGFPVLFSNGTQTPFSHTDSINAHWNLYRTNRTTLSGTVEHRFNDSWKADLSYSHSKREDYRRRGELSGSRDLYAPLEAVYRLADFNNTVDAISAKISGNVELFGRKHDVMAGFNATRERQKINDTGYGFFDTGETAANWTGGFPEPTLASFSNFSFEHGKRKTDQSGVFVATRLRPTDNLSLILGARTSSWKTLAHNRPGNSYYDPANPVSDDREYSGVFTPYAGIVYNLTSNISAYGSYTEIFNPQYDKNTSGNMLDPEQGSNYELGLKGEWLDGRINANIALFEVRKNNLAVWDDGKLTPQGDYAYRAEDNTKGRGWEMELSGEVMQGWHVQAGYTRMLLQDSKGTRLNTDRPTHHIKLFSSFTPASLDRLTVGGGIVWQSETFVKWWKNEQQRPFYTIKPYTVANLMARYAFTDHLNLNVVLNNVFDNRYRVNAARHEYGAPRNVMATLRAQF